MTNVNLNSYSSYNNYSASTNKTAKVNNNSKTSSNGTTSQAQKTNSTQSTTNKSCEANSLDIMANYNVALQKTKSSLSTVGSNETSTGNSTKNKPDLAGPSKQIRVDEYKGYHFGAYTDKDMVSSDKISLTKSKKGTVVAINIKNGDIKSVIYPQKSSPNNVILLQDSSGYPIGQVKYDADGKLKELISFTGKKEKITCQETTAPKQITINTNSTLNKQNG